MDDWIMTIMLDIFAAAVIGGIILVSIFGMMGNINTANYEKTLSTNVQGDILTIARIIESDMLKIGYHSKDDGVQYADSASIRFKSDLLNTNNVVSVKYYLGGDAADTKNPNDRIFVREVTGQPAIRANVGLTYFNLTYFDTLGRELQSPRTSKIELDSIKAIKIVIRLESGEPVYSSVSDNSAYQSVYWEKTIYPKNLMH